MYRFFFPLLSFLALASMFLLITCRELPTNPFDDPGNVTVALFIKGNTTVVQQNDSISVGVIVIGFDKINFRNERL